MSYLRHEAACAWRVCACIDWTFCFLFQDSNPSPCGGPFEATTCRFFCALVIPFYPDTQDLHRFSLFLSIERYVAACRNRPNALLEAVQRTFGQVGLVQCYKVPCVLASAMSHWSCTAVVWDFCAFSKKQARAKFCSVVRQLCWLARMHRSTEINPNSSSYWLNLI